MSELNPRNLIDRKAEQELFQQMASFNSAARVLTICDKGGLGKSSLLKRLRYNCQYELKPPPAACLIELDKLNDPSPFALVQTIVDGLGNIQGRSARERFAKFNELDNARIDGDAKRFAEGGNYRSKGRGIIARAQASSIAAGGVNAGMFVRHAEKVEIAEKSPELTEEQERRARLQCAQGFFDDLRTVCAAQPIVLLFDAWERCNVTLREWILSEFFQNNVLHSDPNLRPHKLGVVIAGRPYLPGRAPEGLRPDELLPFFDSKERMDCCVLSIASLSEWEEDHISEFMVLNGLPEPAQVDIAFIKSKLRAGWSLEKILTIINFMAGETS